MINVLSYVGMGLQGEVCLWTLLGLVRTIFDATLFKMNANLKQVWQMSMPEELTLPVQRVLRTMISGIMLVQCFTVYVYLASYIVLLYPAFLEERPTLVLPWLLLAAIRKLLCELTSLAIGLGTCVLLGPARTPCIKFVVIKVISIMPSFYMWMLVYSYFHALKVASVFKTFPANLAPNEYDYGLELAVRRRRAKSLLDEEQLRRRLLSNSYRDTSITKTSVVRPKIDYSSRMSHGTDTSAEDLKEEANVLQPLSIHSNRILSDTPLCYEDWLGSEVTVPRDQDRILEQFGVMMLRISAFITKEGIDANNSEIFRSHPAFAELQLNSMDTYGTALPPDNADTPPLVGSSSARTASYLRDYPQIFQKKPELSLSLVRDSNGRPSTRNKGHEEDNETICRKLSNSMSSQGSLSADTDTPISSKKLRANETKQKKVLQAKSSEKIVTFTRREWAPYRSDSDSKTKKKERNDSSNKESILQSVIDDINKRRSLNDKSLKKDEIKNETSTSYSSLTLNESVITVSSIMSADESDEGSKNTTTEKASSTHHRKENRRNHKKTRNNKS